MRLYLLTTTAVICAIPAMTAAQDRSAQPPVAAGETTAVPPGSSERSSSDVAPTSQTQSSAGLNDIVVTAQRKSESAQRAAIAIDVVGGADIVGAGITQANRLGALVPALTIETVGPSTAVFIRGVGNFSVSVTSDPAVAFNYDGVYIGRNTSVTGRFFDLDRIEVLKGPQGTLYGRNATAGAINILPTQPKLGQLSAYGTVSYGNYDALVAEGAINLPLGENGAVRVSGTVTNRGGYYSDGTSDDKTYAFRVQVKSNLTPTLTARLSFDDAHNGGLGEGLTYLGTFRYTGANALDPTGHFIFTPTGVPSSVGILSPQGQAFFTSLPTLTVAGRRRDPFPALYQNNNFYGSNADIEWDTGAGVLTMIPAVRWDQLKNLNPGGGFPIVNDQKDIQESVETRFVGKVGAFDYTLGVFYFNESVRLRQGALVAGSAASFSTPTNIDTESYAPFGRLTWHLNEQLRFVAGVRYTHDSKQFNAVAGNATAVCFAAACPTAILPVAAFLPLLEPFPVPDVGGRPLPAGPPGEFIVRGPNYLFNNHLSNGRVTYRGAAEFDLRPQSLLYASVESGYRSGGFSTSIGFETFQPEYLTAYTIGSKNRFFDNRLQLNLEGFYWNYTNQQVAHAGLDLVGRAGNFTQNIGSSTIKGAEVEARVLVTPTTVLSTDIQYLNAKNKTFTYQQAVGLGRPFTNCAVSQSVTNAALFDVNCAGLPGYNSPKWTVNLAAEETVPLGAYKLVIGADTQYKTSRYTYFDYQPDQLQTASWTTNAQVSFGPSSDRWSISGFVRNIENDRLLVAPVAAFGLVAAFTTAPRTYGARVGFKF